MQENRDNLGIEEFVQEILDRVSKKVISKEYIFDNDDFINKILEDMYEIYLEGATLNCLSDCFESFFYNLFLFEPPTEDIKR